MVVVALVALEIQLAFAPRPVDWRSTGSLDEARGQIAGSSEVLAGARVGDHHLLRFPQPCGAGL